MKILYRNLILVLFLTITMLSLSLKLISIMKNGEVSEDYNYIIVETDNLLSKSDLLEINFRNNSWISKSHVNDTYINDKLVTSNTNDIKNGDIISFNHLDFELYTSPKDFYYRTIFDAYRSDLNNRTIHIGFNQKKSSIVIDKSSDHTSIPDLIASLKFQENQLVLYPTYPNSSEYLYLRNDNSLTSVRYPIVLTKESSIMIKLAEKEVNLKIVQKQDKHKMYYKSPQVSHSQSDYLQDDLKVLISIQDKNRFVLDQLARSALLIFRNKSGLEIHKELSRDKKNIIVSQNKLLKTIDYRKNAIIPNSVSLAIFKNDYEKVMFNFKANYLDNMLSKPLNTSLNYNKDIIVDSLLWDKKLKKINKYHKLALKPLLKDLLAETQSLIFQPGISATFAIYNRENKTQRFITSDNSWFVSYNDVRERAVSYNRDTYFKRNFGSFIAFPLLISPPVNDQIEYVFTPAEFNLEDYETISYVKICATGNYSLRGFDKVISGDFSDRNKKIIINSAPRENIQISLIKQNNSVKLFPNPYLKGYLEINNTRFLTNSNWKSSLNSYIAPSSFAENMRNIEEKHFTSNRLQAVVVDSLDANKIILPNENMSSKSEQAFYYFKYNIPVSSPIYYEFNNDVLVYEIQNSIWKLISNGDMVSANGVIAVQIKPYTSPLSPTSKLLLLSKGKLKDISVSRNVFDKIDITLPNIYDRKNNILAFSSPDSKRDYSSLSGLSNLLGFYDNKSKQTVGLESYFKELSSQYKGETIEIKTTINSAWQEYAHRLLESYVNDYSFKDGDLVNDKTEPWGAFLLTKGDGEILVSASYPSIDSTYFNNQKNESNLLVDLSYGSNVAGFKNRYLNHNFKTPATPGSTIKLINAMTLLHADSLLSHDDIRLQYVNTLLHDDYTNNFNLNNGNYNWNNIKGKSFIFSPDKKITLSHKNYDKVNTTFKPSDNNLQKALKLSYNTYFSYAMLHLNLDFIYSNNDITYIHPKGYCLKEDDYSNYPFNYWRDKLFFNQRLTYAGNLLDSLGNSLLLHDTIAEDLIVSPSFLPNNELFSWDFVQAAVGDVTPYLTNFQQILVLSLINEGHIKLPYLFKSIKIGKTIYNGQAISINNNILNSSMPRLKSYIGEKYSNDPPRLGRLYAKTGTSTLSTERELNNSWFVGIWEYNNETYYFSLVLNSVHEISQGSVNLFREFQDYVINN